MAHKFDGSSDWQCLVVWSDSVWWNGSESQVPDARYLFGKMNYIFIKVSKIFSQALASTLINGSTSLFSK